MHNTKIKDSIKKKQKILLVEDDISLRGIVSKILYIYNYNIIPTSNAEDALSIIHNNKEPFSLIITDLNLPNMDGKELVEKIFEKFPEQRVLLVSGYQYNIINGINKNKIYFLCKPYSINELLDKIKMII